MQKCLLIALIVPLLSFGQVNKLLRQGLKSTNFNEQIELFTQVIQLEPQNLDAYFYRGLAKYNLGDYNGAILDYTKVIFYKPDADTYYNRGNSKFALQDYLGAKEDYIKSLELDKQLTNALYNLGLSKAYLGEFKEAILDFNKITNEFPNDFKSYEQKAMAYMELKNYEEAFKNYGYVILLNPNSSAFYNRGLALLSINYYKEAKNDFYKAIQLDKNNLPCYFYIGVTHLFLGEFVPAVTAFTESIKSDALDFDAYLGMAMTQFKANNKVEAKVNFQKAKSIINPNALNDGSIEVFKDTYWYKNQFFYLNGIYKELNAL
ncbi:tetratricopeptide repeat protein [Confluentibacter sediminis]|uniref:tetratricopeptide repeat protein n=1 Tax=Confluentibacter sediminis TaxID=2219045 RepID=UPI000DADD385|nr:tetratricopeptide repeat protein [Confluentibacter sediminis]